MRKVICTNNNGYTTVFDEQSLSPFFLARIEGIYESSFDVEISENKVTDGGTWIGSVAKVRNIILVVSDRPEDKFRQNHRDVLYSLFPKGTLGTLKYIEDDSERWIDYRVEYVRDSDFDKRLYTISLLCENPYFYSPTDVKVEVASIISAFKFIHEFKSEGEEFGYRSNETIAKFINENGIDGVGIIAQFEALGDVTNPSLVHIERDQHLKLGYANKPLNLTRGDVVKITTETNNKHIYLIRNGVQTEINEYLTEDSDFIQLKIGVNNIGYEADSGIENLILKLSYRMKYSGA